MYVGAETAAAAADEVTVPNMSKELWLWESTAPPPTDRGGSTDPLGEYDMEGVSDSRDTDTVMAAGWKGDGRSSDRTVVVPTVDDAADECRVPDGPAAPPLPLPLGRGGSSLSDGAGRSDMVLPLL